MPTIADSPAPARRVAAARQARQTLARAGIPNALIEDSDCDQQLRLASVCHAIFSISGNSMAVRSFWHGASPTLSGRTPIEALQQDGDVDVIIACAKAWRRDRHRRRAAVATG